MSTPSDNKVAELELYIERGSIRGKQASFNTLRYEIDGKEGFYKLRVEGFRYGQFGVHKEEQGWAVTHLNTGGKCTDTFFPSEKDARRFVFCIRKLHNWRNVKWKDKAPHLDPDLIQILNQAACYCFGGPAGRQLLQLVKSELEIKEAVEDSFEVETIDFSSIEVSSSEKSPTEHSVESTNDEEVFTWGTVVSN